MTIYKLLNGTQVDLGQLNKRERAFLVNLGRMADEGLSYFEVLRIAIGPGSPALEGRNAINTRVAESPLYQMARDIATRVGIKEGLILAPEEESVRDSIPHDASFISVTQAANLIGITRSAVHQAINSDRIKYKRFGKVLLVLRASAEEYRRQRLQRSLAGVKRRASRSGSRAETKGASVGSKA